MHAVVVGITISQDADLEKVTSHLRDNIVPMVSGLEGFVAGYWVRLEGGDQGRAMIVFESEDAAQEASGKLQPAEGVTLDTADVGEVVANA